MQFDNLKKKQEYYRSLTDYRLVPNSYVIVMLDGRSFSKKVKNKFNKPFDERFVHAMNETTKYLCEQVHGCKFGYCQSDEITHAITDFETPVTGSFFEYRISKILSICASMASAKFNSIMLETRLSESLSRYASSEDNLTKLGQVLQNQPLYEFDCKAWNVPTFNDIYGWLLYRQLDCIRNSKQQTAQTYLSHKELMNLNTDEQITKLMQTNGVDWETFDDGLKYGRFIYRVETTGISPDGTTYTRNKFQVHEAFPISTEEGRQRFNDVCNIPKIEIV